MLISDRIAELILRLLKEGGGSIEISRNDLAKRIGCSPSQFNYVIVSRFTPEMGYLVESKRGGGGYVRIVQKQTTVEDSPLQAAFRAIGDRLSRSQAVALASALRTSRVISDDVHAVMHAAITAPALALLPTAEIREQATADTMRRMILSLIN